MPTLPERMDKIEEDVYFGRDSDNPSIILRLDRIEQVISDWKTIKWLLIGAIVTMLADVVQNHLHLKF